MKEPKYFIVVKDGNIYVVKHLKRKDRRYLWSHHKDIDQVKPRIDGYGFVAPALWTILSRYIACTAVSKNEALSYATFKYIAKHYPEALI